MIMGNHRLVLIKHPLIKIHIYKPIRNRFEKHIRRHLQTDFSIPIPADTLNCEGVKAPTSLVNDCALISAISLSEKYCFLPTNAPSVLTFLLTMI